MEVYDSYAMSERGAEIQSEKPAIILGHCAVGSKTRNHYVSLRNPGKRYWNIAEFAVLLELCTVVDAVTHSHVHVAYKQDREVLILTTKF